MRSTEASGAAGVRRLPGAGPGHAASASLLGVGQPGVSGDEGSSKSVDCSIAARPVCKHQTGPGTPLRTLQPGASPCAERTSSCCGRPPASVPLLRRAWRTLASCTTPPWRNAARRGGWASTAVTFYSQSAQIKDIRAADPERYGRWSFELRARRHPPPRPRIPGVLPPLQGRREARLSQVQGARLVGLDRVADAR